MPQEIINLLVTSLSAASILALLGWMLRNWISSKIKTSIEYKYDKKIAELNSELSKTRESLNLVSERATNVLSQSTSLIVKKRIEAAEAVWNDKLLFDKYSLALAMFGLIKWENWEENSCNEGFQYFVDKIGKFDAITELDLKANKFRIYLTDYVWAYYLAYSTLITTAVMVLELAKIKGNDPFKYLKIDSVYDTMKTALPEYGEFIDEYQLASLAHLQTPLSQKLLSSLQNYIDGKSLAESELQTATEIIKKAKEAESKRTFS